MSFDSTEIPTSTVSEAVELSSELVMPKVYWFAEPASLLPDAVLAVNVSAPPKSVGTLLLVPGGSMGSIIGGGSVSKAP